MPKFEPRAFLEAAAQYGVTFTGGVPAIFTMLLKHRDLIATLDLSKLKAFSIGSAVVPQELIDSLERAFPGVKVKESYGLTEGGGPAREPSSGRAVPRGTLFSVRFGSHGSAVYRPQMELSARFPGTCQRPPVAPPRLLFVIGGQQWPSDPTQARQAPQA
jgi:acyl-CoA synthetase (AMP-forming)/AMP-acid ligase II